MDGVDLTQLMPYCIFQNVTQPPAIFKLQAPSLLKNAGDDSKHYQCNLPLGLPSWQPYIEFYTMSPMIRPLPQYSALIAFEHNAADPHELIRANVLYDVMDNSSYDREMSMLREPMAYSVVICAFTYPVPKAEPLYLHTRDGKIFPTFDAYSTKDSLQDVGPSPLFVFTERSVNARFPFPYKPPVHPRDLQFSSIGGVCLPYIDKGENVLNNDSTYPPTDIASCVMITGEIDNEMPAPSVMDYIRKSPTPPEKNADASDVNRKSAKSKNAPTYMPTWAIIVMLIVSSLGLLVAITTIVLSLRRSLQLSASSTNIN